MKKTTSFEKVFVGRRTLRPLLWGVTALALGACTGETETSSVRAVGQKATQAVGEFTCGYEIETGTYATWPGGYQAWVRVKNVEGAISTDFSVFLLVEGESTITNLYQADYEEVEGGYLVTAPSWLQWQTIGQQQVFEFAFVGAGQYQDVIPYVVGINDELCDTEAPSVDLIVEKKLVTSAETFDLVAEATDTVAVRQVTFTKDGEVIGIDTEAPYELSIELDEEDNGRHSFAASAVDFSGNVASEEESVLVAIGNRYLGSAPSSAADYATMPEYFNQLTPENAGKWGNVEPVRDEFNWAPLDEAYEFAAQNGMRFRMHTLVWGQQYPTWMDELTPEEQLAEIEEWMQAVAERYPDTVSIDVVNEPIHAPPPFAEALGGSGETGWDWMLKSFELAREYFPGKELLLNDYQILLLEQFTQDYLALIELLAERGLIDGIGLQAHFLERAEPAVVAANLNILAATGLPLYISEFDVNFADDARHANVVRDLFTAFWENPSVLGVTNWGHLQGDTWQPDTYLIRTDGSLRPGFDWMLCYVAGGTDCTVPEYVPSGWQGGQYGITLEAELYDEAAGLIAVGNAVGYTDDGDYLKFIGVEFQENWDSFSVTYTKGNEGVGNIAVHLDSLESDPILVLDLPNSGGWGTPSTLELPWPAQSGAHDVYVTFNDAYGVANVDNFRFGTEPPQTGVNLVEDPGLESGTLGGWQAWYGGGSIGISTDVVHSGDYALVMSDRTTDVATSPIYHIPNSAVSAGSTYAVSVWALHNNVDPDTLRLSGIITCQESIPGHNSYPWIQNLTGVAGNTWTQLSGTLTVPAGCTPTEVAFYLEGTSANIDIYVDDAVFINPNIIGNAGFEEGNFTGWDTWYAGGILDLTDDEANVYSGTYSLHMSGRNDASAYNPRFLFPLDTLVPGTTYQASIVAKHNATIPQSLRLAAVVQCNDPPEGHNSYPWIQNIDDVEPDTWVTITGSLVVPDCDPTEVAIYVQGPDANVDIYLDNAFFGAP